MLLAVWAVAEIALQVYDTYETAQTVLDPCASLAEKGTILGLYVFGLALPGGGYSTAGATGIRSVKRLEQTNDLRQTFKLMDLADDTRATTRIGDDPKDGYVTVYRFTDQNDPYGLLPKSAWDSEVDLKKIYKYILDPKRQDFLEILLEKHPKGRDDKINPFVPVLLDHEQASQTGEDWLATIIWGNPGLEGKDIKRAPDLGIFYVPIERLKEPTLFYPREIETERLFVGDDLEDFLETWIDNPYYGPIQSTSERMKQSYERYGR